jgi:wyosine [tRNA(Phe)-imidazoG37] synthetase (radical SAM superfamily)
MMVKLKRNMEKMMSIYLTRVPISGLGEPKIYQNLGDFSRIVGFYLEGV